MTMTIGYFTDCEDCENYENEDECLGCVHYDDWTDNFTPISQDKKAEQAKAHKQEFLSQISKDGISILPNPKFMDRLTLAWKFVPKVEQLNGKLFCVYCTKNYLMACDTFKAAKIDCIVPNDLIGKHVVWDDDEKRLYVRKVDHVSPLSDGQFQAVFDKTVGREIKGIKSLIPFSDVQPDGVRDKWNDVRLNGSIRLNRECVSDIFDAIPDNEEIVVIYKGNRDRVKIKARGIEAIILPIRE